MPKQSKSKAQLSQMKPERATSELKAKLGAWASWHYAGVLWAHHGSFARKLSGYFCAKSTFRGLAPYGGGCAKMSWKDREISCKTSLTLKRKIEPTAIQRSAKKQKITQGPGLLALSLSCLLGVGPRRVEATKLFLGLKLFFRDVASLFHFFCRPVNWYIFQFSDRSI